MIIFTKDYAGPYGAFKKGDTWNCPKSMQKQLPKDVYEQCETAEPEKAETAGKGKAKKAALQAG